MIFYYCSLFLGVVVLLYFKYKNDYQRIERYYFKHNRRLYIVLRAAHFILLATILLNIRFYIYKYAEALRKKYNV